MAKRLVIQIPALNESQTLPVTLAGLPTKIVGIDEIIIVVIDDGSSDDTGKLALENGADYVIRHTQNRGLSRAFMSGINFALELGADIIVNTDADNQYPGRYITNLVTPILEGKADVVIGDRQPASNTNFSPLKRLLEVLGSKVIAWMARVNTPDAPSGFRAYSRFAASRLQVHNTYSYTLETLIQAGQERFAILHIPIETNPTARPSRLHKGMFNFIIRQGTTIIRSYALYRPLQTFGVLGIPFILVGLFFIFRFMYFYFTNNSGVGRYIQSVSLGGTALLFGLILEIIGLLGEAIRVNQRMLEDVLIRLKNSEPSNGDYSHDGLLIYKRQDE